MGVARTSTKANGQTKFIADSRVNSPSSKVLNNTPPPSQDVYHSEPLAKAANIQSQRSEKRLGRAKS